MLRIFSVCKISLIMFHDDMIILIMNSMINTWNVITRIILLLYIILWNIIAINNILLYTHYNIILNYYWIPIIFNIIILLNWLNRVNTRNKLQWLNSIILFLKIQIRMSSLMTWWRSFTSTLVVSASPRIYLAASWKHYTRAILCRGVSASVYRQPLTPICK